jgi:HEAT repeat protein
MEIAMESIHSAIQNLSSIFPWIRRRSVNTLVKTVLPAVKHILAALDTLYAPVTIGGSVTRESSDAVMRYPFLIDALVKIGNDAFDDLRVALTHSNLNVRLSAITVLGRIDDPTVAGLIMPFLNSDNPTERATAVEGLGNTRSPRPIKGLWPR